MYAIKVLTIVFDYAAAAVFFILIYRSSRSFFKATVAWGAVLFLPSVVLNGAVWAQCDIIYSLFLLLSLAFVAENRPVLSCVAFGISFCFKLQSVFFLPILLIYWLKGKLRFYQLLLIPGCYLLSTVPAILAGRNPADILSIYFRQTGTYNSSLTFHFPNIYSLVGNAHLQHMGTGAVLLTVALLAFLFYFVFRYRFQMTDELGLLLSVFVLLLIPYFLPYMHERYAFPADIFALLLFLRCKKYFWILLSTQLLTVIAYQPFLLHTNTISHAVTAVAYLVFLGILSRVIYRCIQENLSEPAECESTAYSENIRLPE